MFQYDKGISAWVLKTIKNASKTQKLSTEPSTFALAISNSDIFLK